jgi:hypothetical protein
VRPYWTPARASTGVLDSAVPSPSRWGLLLGVSDSLPFGEKSGFASVRVKADTGYPKKRVPKRKQTGKKQASVQRAARIAFAAHTTKSASARRNRAPRRESYLSAEFKIKPVLSD